MNIEKIMAIGLSEKEARLYVAALQLGTASITDLSKKAKIKRPTTYLILESLLKKNLLTSVPKGKNSHYTAGNPILLVKEIEERKTALTSLLPELTKLFIYNSRQSKTKYSNDKKKQLYTNTEKSISQNIRNIFSVDNFIKSFTKKKHT